jgi:hypothetical protein
MRRQRAALLGSIIGLLTTANGYRPIARKGRLSMASMAFGLLASELPRHVIAGQITAVALVSRRLSGRWRWAVWLISGLSSSP